MTGREFLLQVLRLPRQLAAAFRAMFGVPSGPAHLSVPTDVQNASLEAEVCVPAECCDAARPLDARALARIAEQTLAGATRLAVLAGRGCVTSPPGAGPAVR